MKEALSALRQFGFRFCTNAGIESAESCQSAFKYCRPNDAHAAALVSERPLGGDGLAQVIGVISRVGDDYLGG